MVPSYEDRSAAAPPLSLEGLRVLAVDDDPDTLDVVHRQHAQALEGERRGRR